MTEVEQFVEGLELDYKNTGNEIVLTVCPYCGDDKGKFYMNRETGLFDCKICAKKGNLRQFQQHMGYTEVSSIGEALEVKYKPMEMSIIEQYQKDLATNKKAYDYLLSRGFTDDTIKFFRLGVRGQEIAIPHFQGGNLWNIKFRSYEGKKTFTRVTGQPTVLFNIDNVDTTKRTLIVVESETDCIATKQLGFNNVVAVTGGAQTFKAEWLPFFHKFKTIFLCLNSDEAGQQGAKKFAEKIGYDKIKNVVLPTKDVNEYLLVPGNDRNTFELEFNKAKKFDMKDVSSMSDYVNTLDEWLDGDNGMTGIDVGFEQLNAVLKGFKPQELIILSGDSGVGKTTWALNVMNNLLQQGHTCLGFFLEGQVRYYIMRMMSIETGIPYDELRADKEDWEKLKKEFAELPLKIYSGSQADMDSKKMKEILPAAVKLHGVEFVMIDNLQKYVRGSDAMVYQRTSESVSALKDLCVDLDIPIMLISHVTKRDSKDAYRPLTMHDLKSSSTIYQDADIVLFLQRDKNMYYEMTVEKNRMGEGGIGIPLTFKKDLAQFIEGEDSSTPKKSKLKKEGFS